MSRPTPRDLPPVHALLDHPALVEMLSSHGRERTLEGVRLALEEARQRLLQGKDVDVTPAALVQHAVSVITANRRGLRPVLNATGILLHTGLGRAPLAAEAVEAVAQVARGYCNLEIDLETGERGKRTTHVSELLRRLTGAEAAAVVNNNAAATVIALRALARGREVVVSRGQLIEIGGSFRLPEIFEASGARLVEVGTTNRTRIGDYERAIGPETAALLLVHPSNYKVVGFTESVGIEQLVALGRSRGVLTIDDIGSGAIAPGLPPTAPGEPNFRESLAAGADLVLGSGDKLLGGPQCGLLVGTRQAIRRVESDPLARAFRVDKMTLAALESTLRLALEPSLASQRIPLWAALRLDPSILMSRAEALAAGLRRLTGLNAVAARTTAFLGGGSLPGETLESAGVHIGPPWPQGVSSEGDLARRLRLGKTPVFPRVQKGSVVLDLRAIEPTDDATLLEAFHDSVVLVPAT